MDNNTHDSLTNQPNLGGGDPTPPTGMEPTAATPSLPPATGTPFPPADAGGAGQPPDDSHIPVVDPDPDNGGPNRALLAVLAFVALIAVGAGIFFATRGGDDSDTIATDAAITADTSTTIEPTTTVEETTTPVAETTTTVEATTTTVVETTTLLPTTVAPTTVAATTVPAAPAPVVTVPSAPEATMWDVIVNSPDLSEFRAVVESAGLIDLLDGPDAVTVFAPSNAAFAAFRAGVGNEAILADLPALVRHHIVNGAVPSAGVFGVSSLDSLAGNPITIDPTAKTVDGATLLVVDVNAAGSVLHVTDKVLVATA